MNLLIVYIAIANLSPAPRNARRHSAKQVRKLAKLITEFGFLVPVLIDKTGRIIAGHLRVEAARSLSMVHVPVIYIEHLSTAQIEALALAENRISDDASYSQETLSLIVADLAALGDFDLSTTGFDTAELDLMLIEDHAEENEDMTEPPSRSDAAVSKVGDLWQIGEHRVYCGDARDEAPYIALLGEERARMSISDIPFNLRVNGHVSGSGRHAEFPMASGEMSQAEFTAFIAAAATRLAAYSLDGGLHYLFIDYRHIREMLDGTQGVFAQPLNMCVWVKRSGGMGSLYRSQHELVFVFKAGRAPHINNVELGKHGRTRTNVWQYAGANSFGKERAGMLERHATSKPIELVSDAILDCSNRGDIVLDAFLGSGTTLLAAERTGRHGRGIELDPYYADMSVERVARITGKPAIHVATGWSFAELAHARRHPGWGEAA